MSTLCNQETIITFVAGLFIVQVVTKLLKRSIRQKRPNHSLKKFDTYGSFHFGSSYKISKTPNEHNSVNIKGQLNNESNIHFIDSAIMEDIPSGPITFSSIAIALNIVKNTI